MWQRVIPDNFSCDFYINNKAIYTVILFSPRSLLYGQKRQVYSQQAIRSKLFVYSGTQFKNMEIRGIFIRHYTKPGICLLC